MPAHHHGCEVGKAGCIRARNHGVAGQRKLSVVDGESALLQVAVRLHA